MKGTDWHIIAEKMTPFLLGLLRLVLDTCEYIMIGCLLCALASLFTTDCLSVLFCILLFWLSTHLVMIGVFGFSPSQFPEVATTTE